MRNQTLEVKRGLRAEAFSAWPSVQHPLSRPACLPLAVPIAGSRTEGSEASWGLTAPLTTRRQGSRKGWVRRLGPFTLLLHRLRPLRK